MSDQSRGRRRVEEITAPQRRTLQELRRFTDRQGFPPTIQELADVLGISPPSVHSQVKQLVRKGYVKRESKKARGLTVVREPAAEVLDLLPVPIVGKVAAGQPILAEQNIVGEVLVESRAVRSGRCFALEVDGDSMIDAGIHDRDLVVVRENSPWPSTATSSWRYSIRMPRSSGSSFVTSALNSGLRIQSFRPCRSAPTTDCASWAKLSPSAGPAPTLKHGSKPKRTDRGDHNGNLQPPAFR